MENIDWSLISAIASSATAIAAVAAPVITNFFTLKHQERIKKLEVYSPRVFDAIEELTDAYSKLSYFHEEGTSSTDAYDKLQSDAKAFSAICHRICALIPNKEIHAKATDLLADLEKRGYLTGQSSNKLFDQLIEMIAEHLRCTAITSK